MIMQAPLRHYACDYMYLSLFFSQLSLFSLGACLSMAKPIPHKSKMIQLDHSHPKLDCVVVSLYYMPPNMPYCMTINEQQCESCYGKGIQKNMEGGHHSDQNECQKIFDLSLQDKTHFEEANLQGPYPTFPCTHHVKIYGGYCPLYSCFMVDDLVKWNMVNQPQFTEATTKTVILLLML